MAWHNIHGHTCIHGSVLSAERSAKVAEATGRSCGSPDVKKVLEYGVRAPVFYGSKQENRFSTKAYRKFVLFLQKSPNISGNLRDFTGACDLRILYSTSLLDVEKLEARFEAVRLSGAFAGQIRGSAPNVLRGL